MYSPAIACFRLNSLAFSIFYQYNTGEKEGYVFFSVNKNGGEPEITSFSSQNQVVIISSDVAKEGIARLTKKIEEAKNPIETQEVAEEITSEEQTEEVEDSENNVEEISEPEAEPVAEIETEIKSEDDFNLDDFTDLILENDEKIDPFAIEEEDMFDDFMDEDLFNDDLDDEIEEERITKDD